jgi:hypothetical protein
MPIVFASVAPYVLILRSEASGMDAPRKQQWQERLVRSGYFFGAVLFHLILFLMVATWVIWKAPPPPPTDEFHAAAVKVPPPPPQPPSSGAAANNPQFEPQPVVVPVVTPPSLITTANGSAFKVDASKVMDQALSHLADQMAQGTGLSTGGGGASGTGNGSLFGSFAGGSNNFEGAVYDLKIGPDHHETGMNQDTYTRVLTGFVANGWNEAAFAPYYKASKKLFTPAIWIPTVPTPNTATEMHLENELTPRFWVGWYKAKVKAPQNGKYHFVGFGDDILAVAVNGQLVLDGSLWPVTHAAQHMPWPFDAWSRICTWRGQNYGKLRVGDSFEVNTIESIKIDVILGDEPGGFYNAFLMIADDNKTYQVGPEGVPLYPLFQLGSAPINRPGDQPPHSTVPAPWTGAP